MDATNIKLQEVSIGYSLPKKTILSKTPFSNVNLSLTARNLLTFYRKAPFDTDMSASTGTYATGGYFMPPSLKSVGFSIKFSL